MNRRQVMSLLILFGPDARAISLDYLLEPIELGPLLIDRGKLYAGLIAFGAAAGLFALFGFTHTGTAIRACADNWLGAKVVGLDVKRLYALAFGLGSACGGIAGCMMIMLDPDTAEKSPAVLKAVAQEHEGMAGIYAAILVEGIIRKGDPVELI